jgi:polysaccharide export outer membrane protein
MDKNIPVANGDIIYVPRAPQFYIYGEVQRPGAFRLEKGMTVMQALSVGGGSPSAAPRGIRVNRHGDNGKVEMLEARAHRSGQENDVIFVSESWF